MKDKSNTFTWEWEDGETGLIRTIKIPMPNLDRDYETSRGWQVESVEDQTRGFDLISHKPRFSPGSNGKQIMKSGGESRFIEVKGRAFRGPISLSANEYSAARRLGRSYWLYVVFNCASIPEVLAIQDPARLNSKPLSKIEQYPGSGQRYNESDALI